MNAISVGNTAFMLVAAALVMFMTPGLAFFYGGMVRNKNVLGTIMQSFIALGVITIIWVLFGYSLVFAPDAFGGLIGSLKYIGLQGVGAAPNADLAPGIPQTVFVVYQMMFAIITPALIAGAFAERMKFKGYILFITLWTIFVYFPVAHWVWGPGGWLKELGVLDFAGGTVVHINAGVAALAAALYLGKRKGLGSEAIVPHNVTMTVLGAAILWFGWFGFNAGSALESSAITASAFLATHVAAAAGMLGWLVIERLKTGKPTTLGAATGCVAGLATITQVAGYVGPVSAIIVGLVGGIVCYYAVSLKWRFGYDDSLDVVGVHMVAGMLGAIGAGLLANTVINPAATDGLFFGNNSAQLLLVQLLAMVSVLAFGFVASLGLLKVCDLLVGLRVTEEEEEQGLDLTEHSEVGYAFGFGESGDRLTADGDRLSSDRLTPAGLEPQPVFNAALKEQASILAEAAERMAAAAEKASS